MAGLSLAYLFDHNNNYTGDSNAALRLADDMATKATQTDPGEPLGWFALSLSAGFLKDDKRSRDAIEKALAINPNFAPALNSRGAFNVYAGEAQIAIPDIERAMRLDPGFAQQYLHFLGLAHLVLGNFETAATMFRERILLVPETDVSRVMLASALGHLGRIDEARATWAELMQVNPSYNFDQHMARLPFKRRQEPDNIRAGLAKAGLAAAQ
jgi:adenylate cyclase